MKKMTDTFTLNNEVKMPCVGFGTYLTSDEEASVAVTEALNKGYRYIDTAFIYGNEKGVGEAIAKSTVAREDIFVISKVWNTERGYEKTKAAFELTMKNLGLEYLDLYLIHWPAIEKQFGAEAEELNAETWRAMEELYKEGKIRAIGVSNFLKHHMEALAKTATVTPMINQIEYHPGWMQQDTVEYCQANGTVVQAWSPFARGAILDNELLQELAKKYNKTTAQITMRWILQNGIQPIPKTVSTVRMDENIQIFDFEISAEDMKKINELKDIGGQNELVDEVDF